MNAEVPHFSKMPLTVYQLVWYNTPEDFYKAPDFFFVIAICSPTPHNTACLPININMILMHLQYVFLYSQWYEGVLKSNAL
jgi:hypothetical protein